MTTETEEFDSALGDAFASLETAGAPGTEATPAAAAPAEPAPAAAAAPAAAEPAPAAAAPVEPAAAAAAAPATTPAAGEPAAPTAAAPSGEPAAPAAAAAAPVEPAPTLTPNDPAAFAAAVAAAVAAAKPAEPPAVAAPAAPAAPAEEPPITIDQFLTDDDKKILGDYDKEWGEVSKAEAIRRRAEMQVLQAQTFRELGKVLAPIVQTLQQSQVTSHFATIRTAHADFDTVLPNVREWVAKQPSLYRPALERVLNQGTATEVVELVGAYKQAVGQTGAVPAVPASSVPPATAAPATAPVVQAAQPSTKPAPSAAAVAATAAVVSQRSNNQSAADPNDFDAALREALGG